LAAHAGSHGGKRQPNALMASGILIDGRAIAADIHAETARRVALARERGVQPSLVFVRVGEDPASRVYVGMKEKASATLGIVSRTEVLPETTTEGELLSLLARLNADESVHGILVQAPLPRHISETRIYASVDPGKDVDGFHPVNVGKLLLGDPSGFRSCTPGGVHELLIRSKVAIEGAEVVILGRGNIVGKPMAAILVQKAKNAGATVTVCHSQTRDVAAHCRRADILIAALGAAEFVKSSMVKPGAVVIDVGVNRVPDPSAKGGTKLVGDVDFAAVRQVAGMITPNPGGVGPMTIAMLMQNTVQAAERSFKQ
jgi:methylenetetrahydrofolate dehydrogenase (NADP+) / methenyltetrahydrofolate cyclohydrolase